MNERERRYKVSQCDKRWFTLQKVENTYDIRYCDRCNKSVHWCSSEDDLKQAVENKWCVAGENKLIFTDKPEQQELDLEWSPQKGYFVGQPNTDDGYIVEVDPTNTMTIDEL